MDKSVCYSSDPKDKTRLFRCLPKKTHMHYSRVVIRLLVFSDKGKKLAGPVCTLNIPQLLQILERTSLVGYCSGKISK